MRPYQIVATERILQRIEISTNYKQLGTIAAGGYVWHTTGSGKTLTSFKAAQLASRAAERRQGAVRRRPQGPRLPDDARVRPLREGRGQLEHLDAACSSGSSRTRTRGSSSRRSRSSPASSTQNKGHAIYDGHVVLIFDECHRSQFGDMHTAITKAFKRYHLFGFTGTPIFAENAGSGGNPQLRTTEQAFGDKLHTYTIVDAINDKNVLPFRIDYVNTIKTADGPRRQAGLRDRHRAGAARAGAGRPGRRLHPRALRPEDEAQLSATRSAGKRRRRLQRAVRHRLDRRREALLRRVRAQAAGRELRRSTSGSRSA